MLRRLVASADAGVGFAPGARSADSTVTTGSAPTGPVLVAKKALLPGMHAPEERRRPSGSAERGAEQVVTRG